jgi:preprotein translocase subunit SecG
MDTIQKAVLIGHTLVALLIIILVLLQRGKGADAGAAFGAGASGTVFGARGSSSFFSRMTAIFATIFFVSSLSLAYLSSQRHTELPASLLEDAPISGSAEVDAVPGDDVQNTGDGLPSMDNAQDPVDNAAETDESLPELSEDDSSDD